MQRLWPALPLLVPVLVICTILPVAAAGAGVGTGSPAGLEGLEGPDREPPPAYLPPDGEAPLPEQPNPPQPPIGEPPAGSLPVGIHAIGDIYQRTPPGDLAPLRRMIGDAVMVGLGEGVHTTSGFSRGKMRVFRFLVERLGFRAFGFETPWPAAEAVREYVETCEGDSARAIRGLFGVWQNTDVVELVEWMCDWNRRRPDDPVHFYGFDVQQPWDDAPPLRAFLRRLGRAADDPLVAGIDRCDGAAAGPPQYVYDPEAITREEHDACLATLDGVERYFANQERSIVDRTSAEDLAWARIRLVGVRAWQLATYYQAHDRIRSFEARDAGMAYVAQEIRRLRFPEARTALWAHNLHISRGERTRWMGWSLDRDLGDGYYALGLVAYRAFIDWPGVGCGEATRKTPGSVEGRLADLGPPYLLVDLAATTGEGGLFEPGRGYSIGGFGGVVPAEWYDGLLFMETAPAMTPLAWEPCGS